MIQLPQKFQSKTNFKSSDKKKIKEQVFIYLVTQIKIYSKNLQLKPNILWFYCIELFKRIPKHLDLLFYEFSTNWYWISKITANYYKQAPIALFPWVTDIADSPLGFFKFKHGVLGSGQRGVARFDRPFPDEGRRRRREGRGQGARGDHGAPLGASGWLGVAYGGGSACSGGRWWSEMAEAVLRWGVEGKMGLGR